MNGSSLKGRRVPEVFHAPNSFRSPNFWSFFRFQQTVEWVQNHADDISLPLLIAHGTADGIADPEGSRRFIRKVSYPDAHLKEYEGGYHELHNDIIREQVLTDIEQWLEQHAEKIFPEPVR